MTSHVLPEDPSPAWDDSFVRADNYLVPSPVWDASLQRGKIIEHAVDVSVALDGARLGLIAEPLVAAAEPRNLQSVRLQRIGNGAQVRNGVEVRALPRLDPDSVQVELDGQQVAVRSEPVGGAGLRLLVPEVDGPVPIRVSYGRPGATVTLEMILRPVRRYQVHVVQHSHLDIGYTDRQHVVRAQHLGYLDEVLRLAHETDSLSEPAQFRWSEEALFSVTDWLATRPESRRREFLQRVAEGRVSLSAMPFNLHTEMCSTDELHELLRPALNLRKQYGLEFRSAMQTDVPGHVIGLPDALSELGVHYLSVAHNWAGRSDPDGVGQLTLPRLFRWRGPEGGEVVVWRTDTPHGLAYMEGPMVGLHETYDVTSDIFGPYLASLGTRPYPLPVGSIFGWLDGGADITQRPPFGFDILHLRTHGRWSDNAGPSRSVSDIVEEWNRRWLFPQLRVSTNEAFFDDAVARLGDSIPTHTGDWNDWWAHGVGSATAPVGLGRRAQNDLADGQTLGAAAELMSATSDAKAVVDPDEGYRQLALWDEHTWGASNSWEHADHGSSAGEHQWYWKVGRVYAALDESEQSLRLAGAALAELLPRQREALLSVYAFNTTASLRTDELSFFLPAGLVPLPMAISLTDSRTGDVLAHTEQQEEAGSRGLGRYLTCRLQDVPSVGFVRVDIVPGAAPPSAEPLDSPTLLQNEYLTATVDLSTGALSSLVERETGRELVAQNSVFGFNQYIYDRYATIGRSNHNSSKFADSGNMALISSRDVGGPAAVVTATRDARGEQLVLRQQVVGARWLQVTYRLPAGVPHLEITNRVSKESTWDKESAFFAFPFAADQPEVLEESAGGLTGPGQAQVPGGAEYMRAIRHFVSLQDGEAAIGWATAEAPLIEIGTLSLPYVPFTPTLSRDEPGTIFSWIHNNIWDTNFPVEQSFETDLRYRIAAGSGDAPSLASRTASSLVQPLRAVLAERTGDHKPLDQYSLLAIADPRVQLIGLRHEAAGRVLVRLRSNAPEGLTTRVTLPAGITAAASSTYLGEEIESLGVSDGSVEVTFSGSGARAVLLSR